MRAAMDAAFMDAVLLGAGDESMFSECEQFAADLDRMGSEDLFEAMLGGIGEVSAGTDGVDVGCQITGWEMINDQDANELCNQMLGSVEIVETPSKRTRHSLTKKTGHGGYRHGVPGGARRPGCHIKL